MTGTTPQLAEFSRVLAESRKQAIANAQTFPVATSPAKPVEIAPTKELQIQTVAETEQVQTTAPTPQILPTTATIKTSAPMQTKSDQYFPIIIQPGSGTTNTTDPNAPTPQQKTNQTLMWGFGILVALILMVWLLNRKTA